MNLRKEGMVCNDGTTFISTISSIIFLKLTIKSYQKMKNDIPNFSINSFFEKNNFNCFVIGVEFILLGKYASMDNKVLKIEICILFTKFCIRIAGR